MTVDRVGWVPNCKQTACYAVLILHGSQTTIKPGSLQQSYIHPMRSRYTNVVVVEMEIEPSFDVQTRDGSGSAVPLHLIVLLKQRQEIIINPL